MDWKQVENTEMHGGTAQKTKIGRKLNWRIRVYHLRRDGMSLELKVNSVRCARMRALEDKPSTAICTMCECVGVGMGHNPAAIR